MSWTMADHLHNKEFYLNQKTATPNAQIIVEFLSRCFIALLIGVFCWFLGEVSLLLLYGLGFVIFSDQRPITSSSDLEQTLRWGGRVLGAFVGFITIRQFFRETAGRRIFPELNWNNPNWRDGAADMIRGVILVILILAGFALLAAAVWFLP